MKAKVLLLFVLSFLCPYMRELRAQATTVTVSGTIKDDKGKPLQSATVREISTKNGTTSDENGHFTLKVKDDNATLEIQFIGYLSQKIKVAGKETIAVVLKENAATNLQDAVVVGTQVQKRRLTTASINTVMGRDVENIPSPSIDNLLQGRVAGLNVQISSGEPGVAPTVVVRGNSRLNTDIGNSPVVGQAQAMSGPLYIIDGVPINPEDVASVDQTGTNFLAGININDIEAVDVQKDAAATAAWGSRGANGVIYIKTRRGRSKTPEFRVNAYGGLSIQPQLLTTSTGAEERRQKMDIINQYASPAQLRNLPQILTDAYNPYFNNATDWQGLFYRNGSIKNVDATMSAAGENVNYRISMNYFDEKGIIEAFGFTRYSLRGNFDFKISNKLNAQFVLGLNRGDRHRGRKYNNYDDNTPVSGSGQPTSFYRLTSFDSLNFQGLYSKLRNKNVSDNYLASITLNYTILPWIRYTFQGSANINASQRDYFQPSNIDGVAALDPGTVQPSFAESAKTSFANYFLSNALNITKTVETGKHEHNFLFTANQQFTSDNSDITIVGGSNLASNDIQVVTGVPQSQRYGSSDHRSAGLLSLSAQLQYDLDNKYLIYGSYRGDASSRFGYNTKWGYFPAVGLGWIVSDEGFMKGGVSKVINFLKLRGSYGVSGSQSRDFYAPFNSYDLPGTYDGSIAMQPSYNNGLTKNDLTWAKTTQKNIGIEAQLFNNRVTLTVDAYDKISKNDYFNFSLPFFTGYSGIMFNAKDLWINNRGVDVTVNARILSPKSKVQWNTMLTLSHNKNMIAKLPNNNRTFVLNDSYGVSRIYAVGQPLYEMFQLKYAGVYNHQSDIPFNPITGNNITYFKGNHKVVPGDPIWLDVNNIGDVWTDQDNGNQYGSRTTTGDPNPKFTGGWVNDFNYKDFSITVLSVFTWKRDVVNTYFQQQVANVVGGYSSSINSFAKNRLPDFSGIDYWTPEKAAAKPDYKAEFPSINPFGPSYYQYIPISSMFNEDGSYFKIKTVTLSYQVSKTFLQRLKVKGARVYGMLDNVFIFKNSNMPDPEAVDQLGNYTGGMYPVPRKFTLGLDIQF
jgi:TonB-linked SusC/RagA family outer membrane protein